MKTNFLTKKYFSFGLVLLIVSSSFLFGHYVKADIGVSIAQILGYVISAIISALGLILTTLFRILIWVCGYNDFIKSAAVANGWVIVRDLCNMFFILILLVVAFATILRIESYQWKKILPKLLIMAVLINFSKTICGLIIDFAQVIMLTFVNGFAAAGEANLTTMLGIDKILSINPAANNVTGLTIFGSYMLALIYVIIALIVTVVIIAVLVMRMVMLWVYIVLSPIAFLAAAFPAGQKYSSQWWGEFSKNVIVGPVLAFFIWLSFISATTGLDIKPETGATVSAAITVAGSRDNMIKFIISIGMLVGGLMVTQQLGGIAASIAGKGMAALQKGGAFAGKAALSPLAGAKVLGSYGIDKLHEKTGVDLNVGRVWTGIQEKRQYLKRKRYDTGMQKASAAMRDGGRLYGALAMTGTPGTAWEQLTTKAGWLRRGRGGISSKKEIDALAVEREKSKESIQKIETSDEYKKALEVSKAMAPQQKHDLSLEQGKLVDELDKLTSAIELAENKISVAKAHGDEVTEKIARDESEDLKKQKELKINTIASNEKILNQPDAKLADIYKAQDFLETKNKEITDHKKDIAGKNDQILNYKPMVDFDAVAAQGALESEEMKKVDHIKDREELASMLRDAMKSGDKTRFSAIALKLTKDGNENDGVLNNLGFSSNAEGLKDMVGSISDKDHKNYMGFSDQEAKALGMKMSYAAEANNHWGTARAFTMEDGRYRDSTSKEQTMASVSEIAKMDPQQIALRLNRLGYGGESPDGKFNLNEFGLALLKTVGPKVAQQMGRFNPNAAARLSTPENIKLMVEVGVAPGFIAGLKGVGGEQVKTAGAAIDELEKSGYFKKT